MNIRNLTEEKHFSFLKLIQKINSSRNFYFIKNIGKPLNENLNVLIKSSIIKIVQSNFPDSIFLPLVVSLYGNNIPNLVLFIEGDDLINFEENRLIKWFNLAYKKMYNNNYDYIFGNFQIIDGKRIGCSLLLSKATIIQHLLFYTDSDTTHANPFIQLSLANKTKFCFFQYAPIKFSELENINKRFSVNMNCPLTNSNNIPSFCTIVPAFKRDYFNSIFYALSKQTYKPKFYVFIQNDDRKHFNLTIFKQFANIPIYHIWMQNWNSYFFLNHRLSSVFPCDFILKYDDDQWPIDNNIQETLINKTKNKNFIIGGRGFRIKSTFCGFTPKIYKEIDYNIVDHSATPFLIRQGYLKLDARNKIYSLYHAEDTSLSVNSWKLCNVTSIFMPMKIIHRQNDGNNHAADAKFKLIYKKEKNIFIKSYCYLIRSGYIPKRWVKLSLPKNQYINITIEHKKLF